MTPNSKHPRSIGALPLDPSLYQILLPGFATPIMEHYTALGGSNTCGHGLRAPARHAFQQRILRGLRGESLESAGGFLFGKPPSMLSSILLLQPSCIPAMGPEYPASCLAYFAPNSTRYATLEFTPNLGSSGNELERNALYLERMAQTLVARGVCTILISLVPQPPACSSCARTFLAGHAKVVELAERTGLPLVTKRYDANQSEWSDDLKHLNEDGHRAVAEQVLGHFEAAGCSRGHGASRRHRGTFGKRGGLPAVGPGASSRWRTSAAEVEHLPQCVFGSDLNPLILPGSRGFQLSYGHGKTKDKPGLLATQPGSLLRLCLPALPPSFGVSLALERSDQLPMSNLSLGCEGGCGCPFERLSNGDWTLHFRGQGGRRATENYMHRVFGTRRVGTVATPHAVPGRGTCDCVLTLQNTRDSSDPNARAKINGLVAGEGAHIGWANRFHMGLNPNVLSG